MKRLIGLAEQFATTPRMLILFGVMLVINILAFPNLLPADFVPLDLQFSYSPEKAFGIVDAYGTEVREKYRWVELTVDIIYPIVYSLLFSALLFKVYGARKIVALPFLITLADFLENVGIVSMLGKYPEPFGALAQITSFFSSLKWTLLIAFLGILLYGILRKYVLKR